MSRKKTKSRHHRRRPRSSRPRWRWPNLHLKLYSKEVKPEEKPPEQEKLEDTKIGTDNREGIKDEGITAPPVSDAGKGVVEAPKDNEDYDKTFTKVEIESEFPE